MDDTYENPDEYNRNKKQNINLSWWYDRWYA